MVNMKKIFKDMSKHVVKGISFAIPLIVIYSVLLALVNSNIIRSDNFDVSEYAYLLIIPVLTGFIANSITDKIVLIPGFILGYFMNEWGLGFIGGIVGGLLLGYLVRCICLKLSIKNNIWSMVLGYLVLGGIGFIVSYFTMFYMARPGILLILDTITDYINGIDITQVVFIVALLALLTTIDLGGPFNKLAYGFILQFYRDGFYHITGPVIISVMLPPLGVFIGLMLFRNRFNDVDRKSQKISLIGGVFGLTEGALAVGYRRPLKIIPILVVGSVVGSVTAALLKLENTTLLTAVLGLFGVSSIFDYLLSIVVGLSVIIGLFLIILPKTEEVLNK